MENNTDLSLVPDFLQPGTVTQLGTHTFSDDEIIRFARKFDPQEFHVDKEKAGTSLFGGLCASGWHTTSVWMRLQRDSIKANTERLRRQCNAWPEFGPSPGMRNLKWLRPVFAGEEIAYFNRIEEIRKSQSKPQWWLLTYSSFAETKSGKPVMQFESTVFIKIHGS